MWNVAAEVYFSTDQETTIRLLISRITVSNLHTCALLYRMSETRALERVMLAIYWNLRIFLSENRAPFP